MVHSFKVWSPLKQNGKTHYGGFASASINNGHVKGVDFVWMVRRRSHGLELNANDMVCSYVIWGKESLVNAAWHSPTNAANRFFKVLVEMP